MESTNLESHTSLTSEIVQVLYFIFLILSVIMLVNILVALLTNTFERYKTNWEEEWKFGLAVMEEQYSRRHAIVIPYNILSYLIKQVYFASNKNSREEKAKKRKEKYDNYFSERFIPKTTERYLKRYQGSFPLSVDEKLDKLQGKVEIIEEMYSKINTKIDERMNSKIDSKINEEMTSRIDPKLDEIVTQLKMIHDNGREWIQAFGKEKGIKKDDDDPGCFLS